ncbi:MAG: N-formylglutamate amidohydrolase [Aestuariivirgaceae bacterium]|nr:N-formylglutamate amidohydrolase [Aestuariivirgaceae bacterium]
MLNTSPSNAPQIAAAAFPAFEIVPGALRGGLILVADHARNALPAGYGTLGLGAAELSRHIAHDIGVEGVLRGLCAQLGVPGIFAGFSRLLIDPNRGLQDPTLIMQLSDGAVVPGNVGLDADERRHRIEAYYQPYHRALSGLIDEAERLGVPPVLCSIHSFTPVWKGVPRPWHAGVLWDGDDRFARPLLGALEAEKDLVVGDNEPYAGGLEGDSMNVHGTRRGLAHALIEIRQDLIADEAGQVQWARRLARILPPVLKEMTA